MVLSKNHNYKLALGYCLIKAKIDIASRILELELKKSGWYYPIKPTI